MIIHTLEEKVNTRPTLNFRTNSAFININQQQSLISLGWDSHTEPEDFKRGYQLAVNLVKKFRIRNWLNDARNVAYLNIENQNWISQSIAPQLLQARMNKLARVVLDEPLAILVSYNIIDKIRQEPANTLQCEVFTDCDNALLWLNS